MTIIKKISATSAIFIIGTLLLVPMSVNAFSAPRCVLNAIVQPTNNGGTTLSWKVYNADTVTISGGIGDVSSADMVVVYPSTATDYTLTATGKGGVDTCTVTAQPTSSYSFGGGTNVVNEEKCSIWVNPDLVVPSGTAIVSWNAGNASKVYLDNGIGNVSNNGSRTVQNTGVPKTYTLSAEWGNGAEKTCSAIVQPTGPTFTGGVNIPGAFVVQAPGVTLPDTTPQVTATYTPSTTAYVSLNQVPYTGPNDTVYILALLAVAIGTFAIIFSRRVKFVSAFVGFSAKNNNDFERAVEKAVIYEV